MDNMRLQLHISGATASHDQKLVLQFVAYLEKFTTKQQSYSRESLLLAQWFSQDEVHCLHEVYYGQEQLPAALQHKLQDIMK